MAEGSLSRVVDVELRPMVEAVANPGFRVSGWARCAGVETGIMGPGGIVDPGRRQHGQLTTQLIAVRTSNIG